MDTPDRAWRSRKSARWRGYDYRTGGIYFVTVCVQDMACLLGRVVDGEMQLSNAGRMVEREWLDLPRRYPFVRLDEHIVMPNHVHGIVALGQDALNPPPIRASLSQVIGRFKTGTTYLHREGVRLHGWPDPGRRLWLRSFHDRVLRNELELDACRAYIRANPARWHEDRLRPR